MERKQFVRKTAFSFGINHYRALVVLNQLGGMIDDSDGLARVVLHKRHVADPADNPAEHRKLQIRLFRDKCELVLPHRPRRHDRIEVGTVVTDQQKAPLRDFFVALVPNPHSAAEKRYTDLYDEQAAIEFAALVIKLVRIHEQSEESRDGDEEKEQHRGEADNGPEHNQKSN